MIPLRDHNPTSDRVWVVWTIVVASTLGFVVPIALGGWEGVGRAAWSGGLIPAAWWAQPLEQWPRLVGHAFLHGGWAHLGGNLVFLVVFGDNVEDRFGHGRFLAFYVLAAATAGLVHALADPRSALPLVGASGAISAILGAYVRYFPRRRIEALVVPLVLPWLVVRLFTRFPAFFVWSLPAWVYLGYWALVQVWEAAATLAPVDVAAVPTGGVAWWAHVGGFGFGLLLAPLFARRDFNARVR